MKSSLSLVALCFTMIPSLLKAGDKTEKIKFDKLTLTLTIPSDEIKGDEQKGDGSLMKVFRFPTIVDGQGRSVVPTIGIVIEKCGPANPIMYFTMKRAAFNFQDLQIFASTSADFLNDLPSSLGCYAKAAYPNGDMHRLMYVTSNYKDYGIQIIVDATEDTFEQIESQAKDIIRSIRVK